MNFYFKLFILQQYQDIRDFIVKVDLITFFIVFIFPIFILTLFLVLTELEQIK